MPSTFSGVRTKAVRKRRGGEQAATGQAASAGVVVGKAFVIPHGMPVIPSRKLAAGEVDGEVKRFRAALETTRLQLVELQDNLKKKLSEQTTRIFDAHLLMIEDVMAVDQTIGLIREKHIGAEKAFSDTIESVIEAMEANQQDQYLLERLEDIRDVERRVLDNLLGICDISGIRLKERVVLVAHDLTPSQAAQLDRQFILGCATDVGGTTSHTAILCRSLEIPSVVGLGDISNRVQNGDEIIVDGFTGRVVINPRPATVEEYYSKGRQFKDLETRLAGLRDLPANTIDGRFIELSANIEFPEEVASVLSHGAKGVGLFRSEFLFLTRDSLPTEQEQYLAYAEVARRL
ncbi:MAG: phosphoenolpyruvate-utilizing N-terminal domain-containing protein, partial [Gemmatimonadota bacterium]|nr:phosphoenolpyruvate-utilizing N-terminal domain-containing protein [Gemmatimonadota bacterium]